MHNLSDEELDKLFQDATGQHKPVYNPEDWNRLASKLETSPASPVIKPAYFALGVLILLSGSWLTWEAFNGTDNTPVEVSADIAEAINADEIPKSQFNNATEIPDNRQWVDLNTSRNIRLISDDPTQKLNLDSEVMLTRVSVVSSESNGETDAHQLIFTENKSEPEKIINDEDSNSDSLDEEDTSASEFLDETLREEDNKFKQKKLFIKLALSPDLTAVQFFKADKPGFNVGLGLEYYVWPTISIGTGIYYTRKSYNDPDPEGIYGGGYYYPAQQLEGTCSMLEIPINVYLHLDSRSKTNFYFGTGLSSYVMINEHYTYKDNYNNTLYQQTFNSGSKDWFAVLNVSVGLTRSLTSRMDLQIEPYYKAPLKQLGEGKVRLNSAGAFLNLRYKIL